MPVGEGQILLPIVSRHVVFARADMIAESARNRRPARLGHAIRAQIRQTQQLVDRPGVHHGQKLAPRVGPLILLRAGHVNRSGSDQSDQHVGVHRQLILPVVETAKIAAEPVREARVQMVDLLPEATPRDGRAAFARVVRDRQGEPGVGGRGPQCRLAQARVPDHNHPFGVHLTVGLQVVQRTAQPPGPGADRAPLVLGRLALARAEKQRAHPVAQAAVEIRLDVAVIGRGQAVAALEDLLQLPAFGRRAARLFPRRPPDPLLAGRIPRPNLPQKDARVGVDRLVAPEIQTQEDRRRAARRCGQVDQQPHLRAPGLAREIDRHLLAAGAASQRAGVTGGRFPAQPHARRRAAAVHVALEQAQDLRAPPLEPLLARRHSPAVAQPQRVGQGVLGDFGLVVVDIGRLSGREGGNSEAAGEQRSSGEHSSTACQYTPAAPSRNPASARFEASIQAGGPRTRQAARRLKRRLLAAGLRERRK
jgi:hypothetical protein